MQQSSKDLLPAYPDETPGTKLARKGRVKANNLSDPKREELFRAGMALIYGSNGKKGVCSRS
jgi:hypothetical protein